MVGYLSIAECECNLGIGGTLYNGLYKEAPPERGTFFRPQVFERVGILQFWKTQILSLNLFTV